MTVETEKSRAIPTATVEQDILDTEQEIALMEAEIKAFEMVPPASPEYRLAQWRAAARRDGIDSRREFIAKLRAILGERSEGPQPCNG